MANTTIYPFGTSDQLPSVAGGVVNYKNNTPTPIWLGTQEEYNGLQSYEDGVAYIVCAHLSEQVEDTSVIPIAMMGLVLDPTSGFNFMINGSNKTSIPSTSKRATAVVDVCDKFPRIPTNLITHIDAEDSGDAEANFILTLLEDYTSIGGVNIKAIISRLVNTDRVRYQSAGILNTSKSTTSLRETSFTWEWTDGISTRVFNLSGLSDYSASNHYYLIMNFKRYNDALIEQSPIYRDDFDVLIIPNTWGITTCFTNNSYASHFSGVTNQWAGGLVMSGNYIIQFFTSGRIVVLSKTNYSVVATGVMDGASSSMHCNAVSLSSSTPTGFDIPYLYVSQWTSGSCICHVETISITDGSITCNRVQQITYSGSKFNSSLNWDWSVDAKKGNLWCYGYAASASDRYGAKVALKFNLPDMSSSSVTLSDSDIVDEFSFTFAGAQQDVHIENDLMFYEYSANTTGGLGGVLMINLATKTLYSDFIIPLSSINKEPEGIVRDGDKLYITAHESGNNVFDLSLYTIDLLQSNVDAQ